MLSRSVSNRLRFIEDLSFTKLRSFEGRKPLCLNFFSSQTKSFEYTCGFGCGLGTDICLRKIHESGTVNEKSN